MPEPPSADTYEMLFTRFPHAIWGFDAATLRVVAANQAAVRLYGYSRSEFLKLTALDLRPSKNKRPRSHDAKKQLRALIDPSLGLHRKKDGSIFEARLSALEAPGIGQSLQFVTVEEVTARNGVSNQTDINWDASRKAEDTNNAVFTLGKNGRFLSVNEACERMTGYTHDELSAMSIFDLMAPEYRERACRAWMSGNKAELEVELRTRGGEWLVLRISCSPVAGRNGAEYEGTARDIAERIRTTKFEEGRRRVLECIVRGETLSKVLSSVCEILEEQCASTRCAIQVAREGRSDMVVWSAAWSDSETAVPTWPLLAEKSKVLACNERNGITLTAVGLSATVLQELGPSYPYCWTVPVRKVDGEAPARVVVYRRTCCAPAEHDASLLIKIAVLVDIALEHDRLNSRLRHQANHDALTGLPNRMLFRNHLAEAIAAAEQSGGSLGLIYTDLDDFKMVNDAEGHLAGDELLSRVAGRLKEHLGGQIMVARTSGDEFGILLRDIEGETDVTSLANRILKAMRTPFDMGGRDQFVSTTMGISLYPRDATTAGSLIRCADIALYRAKAEGKGRFQTYRPEMDQVARRRQLILNRLHHATVHPEEFAVVFQPQIELNTGRLSGMEALLRWEAPGLGQISPTEFVPIAEASGLILRIGEWILNEVCRYARQWKDQGGVLDRVAVNVSGLQFAQPNFIDTVSAVLRDTGLEPSSLELELTESVVMRNFADSARKCAILRGLGIAISIDDFGTGYSSLSYLEQLPVDTLKIDASFIRRIALGQATPLLVQAIVGLAHHLGLSVIAEGIETEYQMEILRDLGCDKGQGYWIGKPVAAESVFRTLLDPNCSRVGQRDQPTALIDTASSLLSLCEHTRAQPHEVCA